MVAGHMDQLVLPLYFPFFFDWYASRMSLSWSLFLFKDFRGLPMVFKYFGAKCVGKKQESWSEKQILAFWESQGHRVSARCAM